MNSVFEVGRVCRKLAGRDAGGYCAVEKVIDGNHVFVVGPNVRSRKVSMRHLIPLEETVDVSGDMSQQLSEKFKISVKKGEKRSAGERPRQVRAVKEKPVKKGKK